MFSPLPESVYVLLPGSYSADPGCRTFPTSLWPSNTPSALEPSCAPVLAHISRLTKATKPKRSITLSADLFGNRFRLDELQQIIRTARLGICPRHIEAAERVCPHHRAGTFAINIQI